MSNETEETVIKHIVISGGGHYGFYSYGFLKESNINGLWKIENIKSFYGTSVGAVISVLLCLKYEWTILDKYLIHRPWKNVFNIDIYSILNSFQSKGILNIDVIKELFLPLFKGLDYEISIDITMEGFFLLNYIDLHIFTKKIPPLLYQ